jgi:hypothetical protein
MADKAEEKCGCRCAVSAKMDEPFVEEKPGSF